MEIAAISSVDACEGNPSRYAWRYDPKLDPLLLRTEGDW